MKTYEYMYMVNVAFLTKINYIDFRLSKKQNLFNFGKKIYISN